MAELSYRQAIAAGIAQEMRRDPMVVVIGEDVAVAGGVHRATAGLLEEFGAVRDTPISEQAIVGAVIGAAMTGLRPVGEIMLSSFMAVCWDMIVNQMAKLRYTTDGQVGLPIVLRSANGGGLQQGAQSSQAIENWAMAVPGLKVVAPSSPADAKGLLAAAIRDPDPVMFFEATILLGTKGEVPDGEHLVPLGTANVVRRGKDCTLLALGAMVPLTLEAARRLAEIGIDATVVDLRSLVPLDTRTILAEVRATGRAFTIEENPRLCGWGAEIASILADEAFSDLRGPIVRITTPHIPVPASATLEALARPSIDRIFASVRDGMKGPPRVPAFAGGAATGSIG